MELARRAISDRTPLRVWDILHSQLTELRLRRKTIRFEETPTMQYRNLGGSGLKVPALTLGTATFGGGTEFFKKWGTTDVAEASSLIDASLEMGCNMFDTVDA